MANIINRQQTFATNGTVDAASLHNLIDSALINSAIIKNQDEITTIGTSDLLLIAPSSVDSALAPRKVTVQNLIEDSFTFGTYVNLSLTGSLTYATATGNRTISTSATITNGTITNLSNTSGTIATLNSTTGTIVTLNSTTGTIATLNSTTGTIATLNSTTGTITNLSTTLAGDFTISQGTGTLGTSGVTLGTYGGPTSIPTIVVDAKGRVTTASTSAITSSGLTGFRNRIINGDMRIDQRNVGASQTFTAAAALAYSVDRFYGYCTGANVTGARIAGTAPNEFAYRFTGAASVTAIGFGTRLEATNTTDLAGSTATLSVQLANSLLTSVTWTAYYASTTDAFGTLASPTRTQIATGTFTVTSTLTTYSAQISVPSAATTGIEIVFTVGAQTSGTWTIDNVQLEAGSTATDFERRPIGTEVALCKRYYDKSYDLNVALGAANRNGMVVISTEEFQTSVWVPSGSAFKYSCEMRTAPTIAYYDGAGTINRTTVLWNNTITNAVNPTLTFDIGSSGAVSRQSAKTDTGSMQLAHYTASAEL